MSSSGNLRRTKAISSQKSRSVWRTTDNDNSSKSIKGVHVGVGLIVFALCAASALQMSWLKWCTEGERARTTALSPTGKQETEEEFREGFVLPPCEKIPSVVRDVQHHYEVNELRRRLFLGNPGCLEKHLDLFAQEFKKHFAPDKTKKQLNLHIPKTGGTSLCEMARTAGLSKDEKRNCWIVPYRPAWCAGELPPAVRGGETEPSCEELVTRYEAVFVGNEQYLRHPLCTTAQEGSVVFEYSVTLRAPVERAISHVNHLLFTSQNKYQRPYYRDTTTFARRLNLVQSNYMVWSLMAGEATDSLEEAFFFVPTTNAHLERALSALYQFDYILDLSQTSCAEFLVQQMGLAALDKDKEKEKQYKEEDEMEDEDEDGANNSTAIKHSNVASSQYKDAFVTQNYEGMNQLDLQLYEQALEIMEHDCQFHQYVDSLQTRKKRP